MNLKNRIYLDSARIIPNSYRNHTRQQFIYAGRKADEADPWLGAATILAILVFATFLITPLALFNEFRWFYLIFGVITFFAVHFVFNIILYFKVEDRTRRVEEALPDALHLISANLRAGMTPYQALKAAKRKEFGPLKEELDLATKKAFGTESFYDILLKISKRIKSSVLERTLRLFTTSLKAGGRSAKMREALAEDISNARQLKRELVTATKTYSMFILFTVAIGTPVLLAISIKFIQMMTNISSKVSMGNVSGLGLFAGEIVITADFLTKVSLTLLIVTGLLAGILISVIKEGKIRDGARYSPLIITASLIIFYIAKYFVGGMF